MGCGSSKFKQSKCNHCKAPFASSVSRSYSKLIHHPPSKEGDSYHVVALTSSTLGSLRLDRSVSPPTPTKPMRYYASFNGRFLHTEAEEEDKEMKKNTKAGFEMDMTEAKAWSKMIDEKMVKTLPTTPAGTPPGEPETINAWEMMEGLEEEDKDSSSSPLNKPVSSHVSPNEIEMPADVMESENGSTLDEDEDDDCLSNAKDDSIASEYDTQVISAFRKALDELSPTNTFHLSKYPPNCNNNVHDDAVEDLKKVNGALEMHLPYGDGTQLNVSIEKEAREDHERADCFSSKVKDRKGNVNVNAKEKLVLYFTSLRGIRKTYEDCCEVKLIFKGLGVRVDERDVSMHSAFKEELRELLGESHKGGALPRVFVEDRYIGGADDIRRMDEEGSLMKVLRRCEFFVEDQRYGCPGRTCEACGDVRFVPCETCSGSCKVYYETDEDEDEDEELEEEDEFGFQRCPDCNENGLIRCPICCH